ncbi:MAG: hypothetical protein J6A13_01510 [Paludibacteraceae bacterium]|nr:hypothetical protein [Paludibacteraceae bacterium]
MKRLTLFVITLVLCMSAMAQVRMHIWKDGKSRDYVVYDLDNMIPTMDSVTFTGVDTPQNMPAKVVPSSPAVVQESGTDNAPQGDRIEKTNAPTASSYAPAITAVDHVSDPEVAKKIEKEQSKVKSQSPQAKAIASTILYQPTEGEGLFSVGNNRKVVFAHGNLRYSPALGYWSFTDEQYDVIDGSNESIGSFGWSADQSQQQWGAHHSTKNSDYAGDFADWGINTIGNDVSNTWRTLSADEWNYLLNERDNADLLKGVAQVGTTNGLILLPDNWIAPMGIEFKLGFHSDYGSEFYGLHQTFSTEQWQWMEDAGAIFLPADGVRSGNDTYFSNIYCNYWTSSPIYDSHAQYLCINSAEAFIDHNDRSNGRSVRLVKDTPATIAPKKSKDATTTKATPSVEVAAIVPTAQSVSPAPVVEPVVVSEAKAVVSTPKNSLSSIGCFAVSDEVCVSFAPGNLQYTYSSRKWQFAKNQYDTIGSANVLGNTTLGEQIDMFGWSTPISSWGVSASSINNDYSGEFVDWGKNTIGKDKPNTWRTLTSEEWDYLLNLRPNAESLKGVAQVAGVNGLILLSDDWSAPAGIVFKSGFVSAYDIEAFANQQMFSEEQWALMEEAGAVFLPAVGMRNGANIYFLNNYCNYWSATPFGDGYSFNLSATPNEAYVGNIDRNTGQAVRLVKNTECKVKRAPSVVPTVEDAIALQEDMPAAIVDAKAETVKTGFSVSDTKQVLFASGNLQYTLSTKKWSFAENQYDTIGSANVVNGALGSKIDLFGHSSKGNAKWGVSISTNDQDYNGEFVDWGTLMIDQYPANTWRTLTAEEWDYVLNTRANATMLKGLARVVGVNGLVLLPDNWDMTVNTDFVPGEGGSFASNGFDANQLDAEQWQRMEAAGAVFLPATGTRIGTNIYFLNECCYYWSATSFNSNYAFYINVSASESYMTNNGRSTGQAVRLVKDI